MVHQAAADNLEESDDLDWKEMLPQPPRDGRWNEFAKDVAAMANTRGGLIIFGVQDKTTALTGIDPEQVNRQQYAQWIRNHVQPYLPDLDIFELTDGTKTVLIVDVPASEMAPHFVHGGAARDKEQQAAVVPYRDNDHTAWMAEHQIERAYRDRFARVGRAEEEIQRHIDFTTQTVTAHAHVPSAWFIAVSRPQRPLPRGAYTMSRDQAREVLEAAKTRARVLHARDLVPGPLVGMGPDTRLNPRPGLHRWVCNNLQSPMNREIITELHYDGTVVMAANLSFIRAGGRGAPRTGRRPPSIRALGDGMLLRLHRHRAGAPAKVAPGQHPATDFADHLSRRTQGHGTAHLNLGRWGGDGAAVHPQAPPSPACSHRALPCGGG